MKQEPLTRKLVCKTIDAQFFPSSFGGPYSNSEEADGLLSRIHAAYAYYRWNKKTGYPHTMPQFYGGWAMKVAGGMDEKGHTVSRHVGLVLIEHIDGFSVEDLCIRDDDDQDWGTLAPRPGPVRFRTNGNEYKNITFDLKTRQLVMQQAIHGVVQGFQLGVEHHDFGPWNIFVTMRDGYQGLRELRVVILDHNDTQVWYETKYAKKSGRAYCLQKLPHPVHPAERCSAVALEKWRGFWPPTSDQCSGADADKQFAAWLRHKDVFGPKVEAKTPPYRGIPDENLQSKRSEKHLKKSVVQRPYAQKTYSTFDTLDLIGEREDAIDNPIIPTIMGELGVQDKPEEFVKGIEMALRRAFLGGYQMKSEVNGSPYPGPDHIWWKAWRDGKPAPHGPTRRLIERTRFRIPRLRAIRRSDSSEQPVSGDYPPAQGRDISTSTSLRAPGDDRGRQESSISSRGRGHNRRQSSNPFGGGNQNRQQSTTPTRGRGNKRQQSSALARGDSITLHLRRRENRPSQGPTTPTALAQQFPGQENRPTSSSQEEMDLEVEGDYGY